MWPARKLFGIGFGLGANIMTRVHDQISWFEITFFESASRYVVKYVASRRGGQ